MPALPQLQSLGSEGAIKFLLTPIKNGTSRLYLIDVGQEVGKNRITLLITKDVNGRSMTLELRNDKGESLSTSKSFPEFQLGSAFQVELEWSSQHKIVAVYINDQDQEFLKISGEQVHFDGLGNIVHSGEDLLGENKTEMIAK